MKTVEFGKTGLQVSQLGLGTSSFGFDFTGSGPVPETAAAQMINAALDAGINFFDTAPWYGHGVSETTLGKVLPKIPRDKFYISTKVGRYLPEVTKQFDFSYDRTLASVDESLKRLGLDYVDVIQVHDMEFAPTLDVIIEETLPALEQVRAAGKARHVGITGYPLDNFLHVLERTTVQVDSVLSYCHAALYDSSLLTLIPQLKSHGVGVISASPFGMGLLTEGGPAAWHPASQDLKTACSDAAQYAKSAGSDIARLAFDYSSHVVGPDVTLFGCATDVEQLHSNVRLFDTGITEGERKLRDDISDRFLKPLSRRSWEGTEVDKYRRKLKAALGN